MDAVKALQADGRYKVVVMTTTDYGGDYEIGGIKVYQFPRARIGSAEYCETFLIGKNNRLFLDKLKSIGLDAADIAVCHVHDFVHYVQYALAIKKRNPKCLTLVHHHFAGFYDLRIGKLGIFPIWSYLLYRKMRREFESVDAHIFISEHCRRCYGHDIDFDTGEDKGLLYDGFNLPDSYVWYNGVDTNIFKPAVQGSDHKPLTVGCVGNFNPCKCQMDLIKAFELVLKTLPNAKLKLVGNGKTYDECVEYVISHGLSNHILFLEPVAHNRLADFYRSINLLVTPSVNEGFCCVNAEANYCGTQFIAIKGLPAEEILDAADYDRWLVSPHDVEGLAKKILEFASHPQKQKLSIDLDVNNLARQFVDWTIAKRKSFDA